MPSLLARSARHIIFTASVALLLTYAGALTAAPPDETESIDRLWKEERNRYVKQVEQTIEQPAVALDAAKKALAIDRQHLPASVNDLVESSELVSDLGLICGEIQLAEEVSRNLLETLQEHRAADHWRVIAARVSLDSVIRFKELSTDNQRKIADAVKLGDRAVRDLENNKLAEALRSAEETEAVKRDILGVQDHGYATALSNVGLIHLALGRFDEAENCFRRTLEIRRSLFGSVHPVVAETLIRLGQVLRARGKYNDAVQQYVEAEKILRTWYVSEGEFGIAVELANLLNSLGLLYKNQSRYAEAVQYYEDCLTLTRELYPTDKYPNGHLNLAALMNNIATLSGERGDFVAALDYGEKSVDMLRRLFPFDEKSPGHPFLAGALNNLGDSHLRMGNYQKARRYHEKSLEVSTRLFPVTKYPNGHPNIADSLLSLGELLREVGDYAESERQLKRALDMWLALYPTTQYPNGHKDIAEAWYMLGLTYEHQRQLEKAHECFEKSVEIRRRIATENASPDLNLALNLNHLGEILSSLNDAEGMRARFGESLEILHRIYPPEQFPQGHLMIAATLNAFGRALLRDDIDEGIEKLATARQMIRDISAKENIPSTRPEAALTAENLGFGLFLAGRKEEAITVLAEAFQLQFELTESFVSSASEAESLTFVERLSQLHDGLLTFVDEGQPVAESYERIWKSRRAVQRVLSARQRRVSKVESPEADALLQQYLDARFQLGASTLATLDPGQLQRKLRQENLSALTSKKEDLERRLADLVPGFDQELRENRTSHTDLVGLLPEKTILIDIVFYNRLEQIPARGKTFHLDPSYTAFIMRPKQPLARVDLGLAKPIDEAVEQWRRAIREDADQGTEGEAGQISDQTLRTLVWDKLEPFIPSETATLYVCPDRRLATVPWGALRDRSGKIILEKHEVALVPNGQYLLQQLKQSPNDSAPQGLVVGNIDYDAAEPATGANTTSDVSEPPPTADAGRLHWSSLPSTAWEMELVNGYLKSENTTTLSAGEATTARVIAQLPRCRIAHFATHGFFATAKDLAENSEAEPEKAITQRNPLTMSGLVLAGANRPTVVNPLGIPQGDGGILTAEAIAALPLDDLDLVVLSACSTGLGEIADFEGVFGLQRAFHMAGTKDVIASLWQVDDQATAALMQLFYHHLLVEKKTARQALREAQLTLYHHPELIQVFGKERGINLEKQIPRAETSNKNERAHIRLWGAFILSGVGG